MIDLSKPRDLLIVILNIINYGWYVPRMLREYRGNRIVTFGVITWAMFTAVLLLGLTPGLPFKVFAVGLLIVVGFALLTLFFALQRLVRHLRSQSR